ncbi:MAG: glycerophosphodiester phosphodiesterase family protein [Mariniphaga sp.]|nr:glycerophosphodiester phosphodiesterase family protein [Mariniphaga sp.]
MTKLHSFGPIKTISLIALCSSFLITSGCQKIQDTESTLNNRLFIAHRGVNMGCTIAGENSLEAIKLAKKAGFQCIETDVRLTADSVMIVMHDETLNRTCLTINGTELTEKVFVAEITMDDLNSNYILKATEPENRTNIPTLKEFLVECRKQDLLPFIEPKIYDETGKHYKDIIDLANEIMGKNNYIITSNNRANIVIRELGLNDVPLMGILYQTTFEEIESLGNIIMAISTSQFTVKEFEFNVNKAKRSGFQTESHTDNFHRFAMINNSEIDYISTDFLAPDIKDNSLLLIDYKSFEEFHCTGKLSDGVIKLSTDDVLTITEKLPEVYFGGIYLELEIKGNCEVVLANQKFTIENSETASYKHQLMLYNSTPPFSITAKDKSEISYVRLRLAEF